MSSRTSSRRDGHAAIGRALVRRLLRVSGLAAERPAEFRVDVVVRLVSSDGACVDDLAVTVTVGAVKNMRRARLRPAPVLAGCFVMALANLLAEFVLKHLIVLIVAVL